MFSAEIWTVTSSFHPFSVYLACKKCLLLTKLVWKKVLEARGEFEVTFQVAKAQIRVQNRPNINVVDFFLRQSIHASKEVPDEK